MSPKSTITKILPVFNSRFNHIKKPTAPFLFPSLLSPRMPLFYWNVFSSVMYCNHLPIRLIGRHKIDFNFIEWQQCFTNVYIYFIRWQTRLFQHLHLLHYIEQSVEFSFVDLTTQRNTQLFWWYFFYSLANRCGRTVLQRCIFCFVRHQQIHSWLD